MSRDAGPWYREGLSFTCTRCGACCTGAPGYVWVNVEEISRLAEHRGETLEVFSRQFVRRVNQRFSLIERPGGDCIFWDQEAGCTVYEARPIQCRTWPFWPENIASPEAWEDVKSVCPGSGQGQFFSVDQIRDTASKVHTS
ncbi:YkgJ family cysteine cluster protein [Tundrisphaera lichenicola]|uniref:YkgJ family cysteine cluster protein n=1 Tax=Tundrisphaera lichenicola TaxID=2029860 RepID=UPI003EC121B9